MMMTHFQQATTCNRSKNKISNCPTRVLMGGQLLCGVSVQKYLTFLAGQESGEQAICFAGRNWDPKTIFPIFHLGTIFALRTMILRQRKHTALNESQLAGPKTMDLSLHHSFHRMSQIMTFTTIKSEIVCFRPWRAPVYSWPMCWLTPALLFWG